MYTMPNRKNIRRQLTKSDLVALIDLHRQALLKNAFFIVGNLQDAEDIVQDVFVKFYRQSPALDEASKTKAYLYRMVNNAGIDVLRQRKQRPSVEIGSLLQLPDEKQNGWEKKRQIQNEFRRISRLLEQIPEEQSAVIRMRAIDELSFVEIARILQLPVTTVKSRFTYGIGKLRQKTEKEKEVHDGL